MRFVICRPLDDRPTRNLELLVWMRAALVHKTLAEAGVNPAETDGMRIDFAVASGRELSIDAFCEQHGDSFMIKELVSEAMSATTFCAYALDKLTWQAVHARRINGSWSILTPSIAALVARMSLE